MNVDRENTLECGCGNAYHLDDDHEVFDEWLCEEHSREALERLRALRCKDK